jgi:glutamate-5-semialdehyde dehydrogenase
MKVRTLVVKAGTRVLLQGIDELDRKNIDRILGELVGAREAGRTVILVSSGAIGAGLAPMGLKKRPATIPDLQACAAVGQSRLMRVYNDALSARGYSAAQLLLTHEDFQERRRYMNLRNALAALRPHRVIPVINENDTVSVDEIKFGDNDILCAMVSNAVDAELTILLSDVDGLYSGDPRRGAAERIDVVEKITPEIEAMVFASNSGVGTGGMASKLRAAQAVTSAGGTLVLADGKRASISAILRGQIEGTLFRPAGGRLDHRKRWIAFSLKEEGTVEVDGGAASALLQRGKSLLAAGVVGCHGRFEEGDPVAVSHNGKKNSQGAVQLLGGSAPPSHGAAVARGGGAAGGHGLRRGDPPRQSGAAVRELAERAKGAAAELRRAGADLKKNVIRSMADRLLGAAPRLLQANRKDLEAARSLGAPKLDRLALSDERIEEMARGLRAVAELPDPVGRVVEERIVASGMRVRRVRVPLGVILMIYEARPNVTAEAGAICLKASNAAILRGGSEARESNAAIVSVLAEALSAGGLPAAAIQTVPRADHESVNELLGLEGLIDLVIPRGGEELIRAVAKHSRIPVLKHFKGNCHVYVDAAADLAMAEEIAANAKTQRPATCNAMEHLLVHEKVAAEFLPRLASRLKGVELRGDERARAILPSIRPATERDWSEEYLDLILGIRIVGGVEEAIRHVNSYGSSHTDAIVTRDEAAARRFLEEVDSASVLWNASTRMADGGEFGLGAEIGISTDKLHARGPMGVEELTTLKWVVHGRGQIRS